MIDARLAFTFTEFIGTDGATSCFCSSIGLSKMLRGIQPVLTVLMVFAARIFLDAFLVLFPPCLVGSQAHLPVSPVISGLSAVGISSSLNRCRRSFYPPFGSTNACHHAYSLARKRMLHPLYLFPVPRVASPNQLCFRIRRSAVLVIGNRGASASNLAHGCAFGFTLLLFCV